MRTGRGLASVATAAALLCASGVPLAAQERVVIRAGTLIDGRGGVSKSTTVIVENGRIASVSRTAAAPASYDLSRLTVLPGLIDTHVHIDTHFGKDGRPAEHGRDTAAVDALCGRERVRHAYGRVHDSAEHRLAARSRPARRDRPGHAARAASADVHRSVNDTGTPEQIREFVRKVVAAGADLVKIFASKSIREGGGQTLTRRADRCRVRGSDEAAASARGSTRTPMSAVRAATTAGCLGDHARQPGHRRELALMARARHVLRAEHRARAPELHREQAALPRHRATTTKRASRSWKTAFR